MLVLSRKQMESIYIKNNIIVTVLEIQGKKVRLGIEAPKEVPVHRTEVYERIPGPPCRPPPAPTRLPGEMPPAASNGEGKLS